MRFLAKIVLIGAGILGVVLGSHGLYIYFSRVEFIFSGKDPDALFMAIGVPSWFGGMVGWVTLKGLQSWFIPGCLVAGGIFLWYLQSNMPSYYLGMPRPIARSWKRLWHRKRTYDQYPLSELKVRDKPNLRKQAVKTLLCITAIAIFIFLVWSAFFVFQRKEHPIWGLNSIAGAVAILVGLAVLILNIRVLRSYRYRWTTPSFKLVLATLLVIFLVCTFAGVQPMSSYKDDAISGVKNAFRHQSSTSAVTIPNSTQVGAWQFTLRGVKRGSESVDVNLSITNKSQQPLVWDASGVDISYPGFVCVDQYNQTFGPEDDSWYNMKMIYPNETVSGKLHYTLNKMSGKVSLYLGENYPLIFAPAPKWFLFDLK